MGNVKPKFDIVFAMAGDVHRNARALRQLSAMAASGHSVAVLSLPRGDVISRLPERVTHIPVEVPAGRGPLYFLRLQRAFAGAVQALKGSLYHASDLYVLSACAGAAKRAGVPYSYDSRELYTHVAATVGKPYARAFWRAIERRHIRKASQVWTVSDSIADYLRKAYSIPRPSVQFNAPATAKVTPNSLLRDRLGLPPETAILLHMGQLRRDRGADNLIDAVSGWPESAPDARLVFLGYGPERERLQARVLKERLENRVLFLDAIPPSELVSAAAEANVGITLLEPTCLNHRFALPNKLFDYLAASLPVVASDLPECANLVDKFCCGLTVNPADTKALTEALTRAAQNNSETKTWKRNAKAAADILDWQAASPLFTDQVASLLRAHGQASDSTSGL
ncbi:MAG: glycosyltransferase involved in cell wall biosynthesis [Rhodothermales bacterium]|jgi:glycosyltransferase involved in cell wall biosynthesis